jgi:acyl-coenzyme A thioesterase PaaI-like protein
MQPAIFQTTRRESGRTRFFRLGMNLYPMYFGTGGKVTFISADWREVHVRLGLSLWTRNYVKTIFGGSFFSASDPFYMLMLMHVLGRSFVVWDKSAAIRFKRPGTQTLYARFVLHAGLVEDIRRRVEEQGETEQVFMTQWVDREGHVYAEIERNCYIASKAFYKQKQALRKAGQTMAGA